MPDLSFLDQEAPPGYVAGLGRGATGFVTSAETGPSVFLSNFGLEVDEENPENPELGLFSAQKSAENEDADKIYEEVEARVQSRHKRKAVPETKVTESPDATKNQLKLKLNEVSLSEWLDLPDAGDLTRKNKRQRILEQQQQRVYATPDVLIAQASAKTHSSTVEDSNEAPTENGTEEGSAVTNFAADPEKERRILASLRKVEPKNANLWISSARYEEQAKQFQKARAFIKEGCSQIPENDEVWIESIRLHRGEGIQVCKQIASEAVAYIKDSEKLWLTALDLESTSDFYARKKLLLRALEFLPHSTTIWETLITSIRESDETEVLEKLRLLENATKMCPTEWKFWEYQVSLSDYKSSKQILNRARKLSPKEEQVWIAALKLEEKENDGITLEKLLSMLHKGKAELIKNHANIAAIDWLRLAQESFECAPKTTQIIVNDTFSDWKKEKTFDELLQKCTELEKAASAVTELAYKYITTNYPNEIKGWLAYLSYSHKACSENLGGIYKEALQRCPTEVLYLDCANYYQSVGNAETDNILREGVVAFPGSERIWLARARFEIQTRNYEKANSVYKDALEAAGKELMRVWYDYIHFLRFCWSLKKLDCSPDLILQESDRAILIHPDSADLHLQKAQIMHDMGLSKEARQLVNLFLKNHPKCVTLWQALAQYDFELYGAPKARSLLDKAILENPELPDLFVDKIELEVTEKDLVVARQLVNKGLKLFPSSADIWTIHLGFIPKASHRKVAFMDALKETENSSQVLLAIGRFLWADGKHEKAKTWFDRGLEADASNGDAWAWMYQYYLETSSNSDSAEAEKLVKQVEDRLDEIVTGKFWTKVISNPQNLDKTGVQLLALVGQKLLDSK